MNTPPESRVDNAERLQEAPQDTKPWIRYRVQYRSFVTNELLDQKDIPDPRDKAWISDEAEGDGWPVFDVIKTIRTQKEERENLKAAATVAEPIVRLPATLSPTYSIRIYSPAIINAIQSIVKYYPSQDLTGDSIVVQWPYAVLVHHYDELHNFISSVKALEPEKRCHRERDVEKPLHLLFDYLEESVMPGVREERERNSRGYGTFEWYWVSRRPGATIFTTLSDSPQPQAFVIHSLEGGSFVSPPQDWRVVPWRLNFDGELLGRETDIYTATKWDGEMLLSKKGRMVEFPEQSDSDDDKTLDDMKFHDDVEFDNDVKQRIRDGGVFWNLLKKQCQWYGGKTVDFPYNSIETNVMVDCEAYLERYSFNKPNLMGYGDLRLGSSDCTCGVCKIRHATGQDVSALFDDYDQIRIDTGIELTWHQKFLCPTTIPAFVFRTRTWGELQFPGADDAHHAYDMLERLHVHAFSEPKFNSQMIESLVMEPVQLKRLKALAQSFARIDKDGNKLTHPPWSADFVKGKGKGLIFLLHGRPGVGKTCTAESIAEFMRKPLMVLTSSDIGTDPVQVEQNLTRFLRALEFYDGILFLTTNRVGTFDDAFISRIHIQLYYPDFTDDQRQQIWQTFVDKLKRDCGSYMKLDSNAKRYLKSAEVRAMKWNGRDIRNAFQTAVSLAEYDAEKDDDGKILVNDDHFRAVMELSSDFKVYLNELHKKDEAQRAALKHERYDDYVKDDL
ncbi:hypothetical protein FSARC_12235 [Fusarium sarcochroum]|uniref:ATPase AAA-type core domain-containing protein n=1 Tax=Fusarium sarcochroum TaxID=1208366 RepID=A0A8H4T9Z9_9HYPO|nr:hypothetical protein FSARC_12235 [Fusarium sarcochroum]